jgi:tRNA nucleotidyltransferase/poly(A) polymerase
MDDLVLELLAGQEAWFVGGAVRDALLGREVVDVDVVCGEPERVARRYARRSGGAPFPLSDRYGGWRVALDGGRTVDFTPLQGDSIEADLGKRDFTVNAIAEAVGGGRTDPFAGAGDVERRALRAVSPRAFDDDPLRLLRAVRLEDELGFRLEPQTEALVREKAPLVSRPAGERVLAELRRLSLAGWLRLDELGLLRALGGTARRLREGDVLEEPEFLLVAGMLSTLKQFPISNYLRGKTNALLRAERPPDDSPRSVHRFRRAAEPFAVEAAWFVHAPELEPAIRAARAQAPREPLLRGDELGLPPGPEIRRMLEEIAEERAAGTIATREEALELVRRRSEALRRDG